MSSVETATPALSMLKGGGQMPMPDWFDADKVAKTGKVMLKAWFNEELNAAQREQVLAVSGGGESIAEAVALFFKKSKADMIKDWAKAFNLTLPEKATKSEQISMFPENDGTHIPGQHPIHVPGGEPPIPSPETLQKVIEASKGKSVGHSVVKHGTVTDPNPLTMASQQVENLKQNEVKSFVLGLQDETELNFFKLGGALSIIHKNKWFDQFDDMKSFVEVELGMGFRKAMYFIQIYETLVGLDLPWDKVKLIGWTKLKELLPVINDDNKMFWLDKALEPGMTTLKLIQAVKEAKTSGDPAKIGDQSKAVVTKTFKLHEDQLQLLNEAIATAKGATHSEVDTVNLEAICLDYLGKPVQPLLLDALTVSKSLVSMGMLAVLKDDYEALLEKAKKLTMVDALHSGEPALSEEMLKANMGHFGYEKVLEAFEGLWPSIHLELKI